MKPDVYFNIPKHVKKYGAHAAVEVANFEASQVMAVKELVEKERIDCEFTLTRACDVILDESLAAETEQAFEELKRSGVANLKDVHYTPRKDAERVRMLLSLPTRFHTDRSRCRASKAHCPHSRSPLVTSGRTSL